MLRNEICSKSGDFAQRGLEEGNYLVAAGSNELIALNAQGWDAFLNK